MRGKRLLSGLAAAAAAAVLATPGAAWAADGGTGGQGSGGSGGMETEAGNNLSMPLVYAEGIGLGGTTVPSGWTTGQSSSSDWTGLGGGVPMAPSLTRIASEYNNISGGPWYLQGVAENTWRADYEWTSSAQGPVVATAAWGDNLSHAWSTSQKQIRVEVALTRPVTSDVANSIYMQNLTPSPEGSGHTTETWATNGKTAVSTTEDVFSYYAHLTITGPNNKVVVDKTVRNTTDGPGNFAAEVNKSGNVVYGYNWKAAEYPTPGTYKLTFSIDPGGNVVLGCNQTSVTKDVTITTSTGGSSGGEGEETATVPTAPQNLVLTPGDRQIAATWTAPAESGGSDLTGYTVCVVPASGSPKSVDPTTTSATLNGLTNGTAYTVLVTADNDQGASPPAMATATPVSPATVPGEVTNLTVLPGDGELLATWDAPASDGGSAITGYEVTVSPTAAAAAAASPRVSGSTAGSKTMKVTGTSALVTGLSNDTEYTVDVAAVNGVGTGKAATGHGTPSASGSSHGAPAAPTDLSLMPGNGGIAASWTAPSSTGGSAISGYVVSVSPADAAGQTVSVTAAQISGLTNGRLYTVSVAAVNSAGIGAAATATATPVAPQSAVAVTGLNHGLFVRTLPGSTWYNFGGYLADQPALAYSAATGQTYFVARSSDNRLWVRTTHTTWSRLSYGLTGCSQPAAAVSGSTLVVACRTAGGALEVVQAPLSGSGNPLAGSYTNLGGQLKSGPAVVNVDGTMWFIVAGPVWDSHGDNLWARTLSAGFQRYAKGLNAGARPSAAYANGQLFVGVNQAGTTAFLQQVTVGGKSLQGNGGGRTVAGPGVALGTDGTATVFVEGTNRAIYYKTFNGTSQTGGWTSIGGQVLTGAQAVQIRG